MTTGGYGRGKRRRLISSICLLRSATGPIRHVSRLPVSPCLPAQLAPRYKKFSKDNCRSFSLGRVTEREREREAHFDLIFPPPVKLQSTPDIKTCVPLLHQLIDLLTFLPLSISIHPLLGL